MLLQPFGRPPVFPFPDVQDDFSPRRLPGLEYWFDAQDTESIYQDTAFATPATANGQPVGGWKDKASSRHLLQATGTLRPTYRTSHLNGRPAIEADGVDDFLRYSGATLTQPLTIYLVAKLNTTSALQRWFDSALTNQVSSSVSAAGVRRVAAPTALDAGLSDTSPHLHTTLFNTTASAHYVDGALVGGPADTGTNAMDGLTLFAARGSGSTNLSGAIGEFIAYSGVHSSFQRIQVEQFLKDRWGL